MPGLDFYSVSFHSARKGEHLTHDIGTPFGADLNRLQYIHCLWMVC